MKNTCVKGLERTQTVVVDNERATHHLGEGLGVYATPFLLRDIEHLCNNLLAEHFDEGEGSVGTHVDLKHLAASPEGMSIELKATVTNVDRRAVTFAVEAHDQFDQVAKCEHSRFVISLDKVKQGLTAKLAKQQDSKA